MSRLCLLVTSRIGERKEEGFKRERYRPAEIRPERICAWRTARIRNEVKKMYELQVPFEEKEEAKRLGAKWNPERKSWYYENLEERDKFKKWDPTRAEEEKAELAEPIQPVHMHSTPAEKVRFFMELFRGRRDVYARRWQNKEGKSGFSFACMNEWERGVCGKPKVKCANCPYRTYLPLTERLVDGHLRGKSPEQRDVIAIYPLLPDGTCHLLTLELEGDDWREETELLRTVCGEFHIPVAIELAAMGNGSRGWIFFRQPVSAALARRLGSAILTCMMERRHTLSFRAYDRLHPSQDLLPRGGLGSLVPLPMQGRARRQGASCFVDERLTPYADPWAFLSGLERLTKTQAERFCQRLAPNGALGALLAQGGEEESNKEPAAALCGSDFPAKVRVIQENQLYIEKKGISERALNRMQRLAAFQNPEFYKAQTLGLSTYEKPRIIPCAEENETFLALPRGCEEALTALLAENGVSIDWQDRREPGVPLRVEFLGELRPDQEPAAQAMLAHSIGVLAATTAFGKTVVAAYLIAQRKVNTLILVHTQALLQQWKQALETFLYIEPPQPQATEKPGRPKKQRVIGQLGAGKKSLTGLVDIAVMQSVVSKGEVKELVKDYGMVLVDECHHVSAASFALALRQVRAQYVYGLTATAKRQDGHQPIIFMQCGPVRYLVDAKEQAEKRSFSHYLIPRFTAFQRPPEREENDWPITQVYSDLSEDEARNRMIVEDVEQALAAGRSPVVLTERAAHVELLAAALQKSCANVIALTGALSAKQKREQVQRLRELSPDQPLVIVATGKFIGEGFDEPRLDTLFLAMPIAWQGTLAQYAGRLHRAYAGKEEVRIYDYVDIHVRMLEKMYHKRLAGYAKIGYQLYPGAETEREKQGALYSEADYWEPFCRDIAAARKEILLVCAGLEEKKTALLLPYLTEAMRRGAALTLLVGKENEGVALLRGKGIPVKVRLGLRQNLALLDRALVWYGSCNLLAANGDEQSVMRLTDEELAGELADSLEPG